jgi:hypothetical protein
VELPAVVVVVALAPVAAQLQVVAVPLPQQPRHQRRPELQQVQLQQHQMPTPVDAVVEVEVVVQPAAVAARHPSRGFLSFPGPLRSTTTIQRMNPSTIPKGTVCLPVDRDSMQRLTRWSFSSNLN